MACANSLGSDLIPVINRLQDIFAQAGLSKSINLPLPQVAVVGSQSSGKSSVLEALVGRDFLPRGKEICTRRPLILQLVQQDQAPGKAAEWGDFLHKKGEVLTDFEAIRREIEEETEREAVDKAISDKPIRLRIVSPHVLTMTLVDLPGLTKVPVGNQPSNIEAQIRDMIMGFIKHETCLILAVSPANVDLANSDALMLARQVDPQGNRTIGVITKLDIMDRGTDATAYLRGEVVPLKLGYIGVVNRSQADINDCQNMVYAKNAETEFFRQHQEYREVAPHCGIQNLSLCISRLLTAHIGKVLPKLRKTVETKMREAQEKLAKFGKGVPEGAAAQGSLVLGLINKFATSLSDMVAGRAIHAATKELVGGARVRYIFQEIFARSLEELDPCNLLSDHDIWTAIENAGGTRGVLLLPEAPFELLLKQAIARLVEPSCQCLTLVHTELNAMMEHSLKTELEHYPMLASAVQEQTCAFMQESLVPAETMIRSLVDCHLSYINMSHPQFVGASEALRIADQWIRERNGTSAAEAEAGEGEGGAAHEGAAALGDRSGVAELLAESGKPARGSGLLAYLKRKQLDKQGGGKSLRSHSLRQSTPGGGEASSFFSWGGDGAITLRECPQELPCAFTCNAEEDDNDNRALQITTTRVLLSSYYEIVRGSLQDMVPKAIMNFLVNNLSGGIEQHLIRLLFREDCFGELLAEPGEVARKRQRSHETVVLLRAALDAMDQVTMNVSKSTSRSRSSHSFESGKENQMPAGRRHTLGAGADTGKAGGSQPSASRHSTGGGGNTSTVSFA